MASSGSPSIPQGGGKPTGSPAAKPGGSPAPRSAAAVAPTPAPAGAPPARNKLLYGGIAGGVALLLIIGLVVWKPWVNEPPRLNEDPLKIAKFALTSDFKKLPFERQFTYMELLDDKEDAVEQAFAERKLTDEEYAKVQQAAYLGKHLKRARKYAKQSTTRAKDAYLDELIEKKKKKKGGSDKPKTGAAPVADTEDIKRDDTEEQETINTWPAEDVAKWNAYRQALKARKDMLEEQDAQRKAAATQTSSAKPVQSSTIR